MKNFILLIFLIMVASKAFGCDSITDEIKDLEVQISERKAEFNQCHKERQQEELLEKAEEEQEVEDGNHQTVSE